MKHMIDGEGGYPSQRWRFIVRRFPENRDPDATRPNPVADPSVHQQQGDGWNVPAADTVRTEVPLKRRLDYDPFLRYLEENETLYRVLTGEGRVVTVPKDRAIAAPFPPPEPTPLQPVYRWLGYGLLGLPLAGLPTVIFALIAATLAQQIRRRSLDRAGRRRLTLALVSAAILWLMGVALSFLFLLHL